MRILYVTDSLDNGGAERQMTLLASHLPPEIDVMVFSTESGEFIEVLKKRKIPVFIRKRKFRYDITLLFYLWKTIIEYKPTIIHGWGWVGLAASFPLCKLLHIPVIDGTIRSGVRTGSWPSIRKIMMKSADSVIANSQAGISAWKISNYQGRVIYNGFDTKRLMNIERQDTKNSNRFVILMTGRMVPQKDYRTFIKVAKYLSQTNNAYRFIAIGNGPERESLVNIASDLLGRGIFEFPKDRMEVIDYVMQADVGVLLTNHKIAAEGCSNSILEYMACGLPVICTKSGGNPEIIQNGINGYLVPQDNPVHIIADKLLTLKSNHKVYHQMSNANIKKIRNRFSIQNMVGKTFSIYQDLVNVKKKQLLNK